MINQTGFHYEILSKIFFDIVPPFRLKYSTLIIILYYIKNQQDATLAVLFISNCKITLRVSDAFCVHHQEY